MIEHTLRMPVANPGPEANLARPLLLVCLCAQWCGVCRDYAALFEQAAAAFGAQVQVRWVDIEDEADLLDSLDVDNFPTLLIARGDALLFFGTVTPHARTLSRLVAGALAGDLRRIDDNPLAAALAGRLCSPPQRTTDPASTSPQA